MGKSYDAPDPPDYEAAAERQAEASREITNQQTWANRPNQYTPWGSSIWNTSATTDPATGQRITQWDQQLNLSPELQRALNYQQAIQGGRSELAMDLLGRAGDEFGPMVDWDSYTPLSDTPDVPDYGTENLPGYRRWGMTPELQEYGDLDYSGAYEVGDPNDIRQEAEDAIYGRMTSRLDPMWEQRQEAQEVALRNQGLVPGTDAFDEAMGNFNRGRNDAYSNAMRDAIIGGGAESDRMFGQMMARRGQDIGEIRDVAQYGLQRGGQQFAEQMDLGRLGDARRAQSGREREQLFSEMMRGGAQGFSQNMQAANYQNRLRQQQIAEEMQRRGYSLNEINALMTGQQVAQPNMPQFNTASASQVPQYMRAAEQGYMGELDEFNADQMGWQGMMSGILGLGTSFLPWGRSF